MLWVTLAPVGGMKWKTLAGGLVNVTSVKPVSNAGVTRSWPYTWTRSGTLVRLSRAMVTDVISEWLSRGESTSWYTARPATRAVASTLTRVVGETAASTCVASSPGVGTVVGVTALRALAGRSAGIVTWVTALALDA